MIAEDRDGVAITGLDQPLFEGSAATKRDPTRKIAGCLDTGAVGRY